MNKQILLVVIIVFVLAVLIVGYALITEDQGVKTVKGFDFTTESVMEIVKTDKDYNDILGIIKDFSPELISQKKLGPKEYQQEKPQWDQQGSDMNGISQVIDTIELNDFTYLVNVQNKNEKNKGLLAVIDINTKKSLVAIATLKIEAGVGL